MSGSVYSHPSNIGFVTSSQILPDTDWLCGVCLDLQLYCETKVVLLCPHVLCDLVSSLYSPLALTGEHRVLSVICLKDKSLSAEVDPAHQTSRGIVTAASVNQATEGLSFFTRTSGNSMLAAQLTCTCPP